MVLLDKINTINVFKFINCCSLFNNNIDEIFKHTYKYFKISNNLVKNLGI